MHEISLALAALVLQLAPYINWLLYCADRRLYFLISLLTYFFNVAEKAYRQMFNRLGCDNHDSKKVKLENVAVSLFDTDIASVNCKSEPLHMFNDNIISFLFFTCTLYAL